MTAIITVCYTVAFIIFLALLLPLLLLLLLAVRTGGATIELERQFALHLFTLFLLYIMSCFCITSGHWRQASISYWPLTADQLWLRHE
jgi:hypothetical protein